MENPAQKEALEPRNDDYDNHESEKRKLHTHMISFEPGSAVFTTEAELLVEFHCHGVG